jgi:hypothetical protein
MLVRSRDDGKTWSSEPELIYADPFGDSQDPCMVQLRDSSIICTSYGWSLMPSDGAASLKGTFRHSDFAFLGGYMVRSKDGGHTWQSVNGFNHHPKRKDWCGGDKDGTPDGPKVHSIIVDPRDANHLYMSMSSGGTFESTDRGAGWKPLNKGVLATFYPDPFPEYGHDPHCVRQHPALPDRLYQQNHCGIFRIDRPSDTWIDIGKSMPKKSGNIGFPMTLHPRDPDTAWVFPMDGSDVWPRTSPGGKPAVYRTTNGGKTWQRQDKGLPAEQAWWTVKRQAMAIDGHDIPGLYFGTTSGEIWASKNGGESWKCLAGHLPHVYAVEVCAGR